ncbi:MAG: hypothetical protein OH338_05875 [Candidatus Parvarchaeota archaeon]|nr:hypothetical protein [Candidatus Parvarchaeum tengchongense]
MRKILLLVPLALALLSLPIAGFAQQGNVTVSATVTGYIEVTFNYNQVVYPSISAGSTDVPAPNQQNGIYNVTVNTNYDFTVKARGTNFSDGAGHTFSISNLKMDTDPSVSGLSLNNAVALSTSDVTIDSNVPYTTEIHYHGYWLSIPTGQYAGTYTSTVTITYNNV